MFPPPTRKIKVFDKRPTTLDKSVWEAGIILQSTDKAPSVILYKPSFESVCAFDNTGSDASSTFSKSVTTGFTFTQSITIGVEASLEASVEFIKASLKMSTSITFTSQWSKTITETMLFTVPAGKRAYAYQGFIYSEILDFDGTNYNWRTGGKAKCLTSALTTTASPIVSTEAELKNEHGSGE